MQKFKKFEEIKTKIMSYLVRSHIIGIIVSMFLVASLLIGMVLLIFSIGVEVIETPNIIGLDTLSALEALTPNDIGLRIKGQIYNNKYSKGFIVSQDPDPGQKIRKNRDVQVVISKGTEMVKVPDLNGLPIRQAKVFLQQVGLIKGNESYVHSFAMPQNRILAQNPVPGMDVKREVKVNLLVSLGPERKTYLMPDFIGKKISFAEKVIHEIGMVISEIKHEYNPDFQEGTIISQSPGFCTPVKQGERLAFKITRATVFKDKNKLTRYVVLYYIPPVGVIKKDIRIVIEDKDDSTTEEIFSGKVLPGDKIQLIIRASANCIAKIYMDDEIVEEKKI